MGPFIDGVYSYCDRWCERCRFQTRCRVFRDIALMESAIARGESEQAVSRLLEAQYEQDERENAAQRPPRSAALQVEWDRILELASQPLPPEERAAIDRAEEHVEQLIDGDPLMALSREYDELARGLATSLRPLVDGRDDGVLKAGVEIIERFGHFLPAKVHRALSGVIRSETDDDDDIPRETADWNGTAKLVRVTLAEARLAWEVLRAAGIGNGAAEGMIHRVDVFDAAMAARFPEAMAFVRPGFDEAS